MTVSNSNAMAKKKFTPSRVKTICRLVATGEYSFKEICAKTGVSYRTFCTWRQTFPAFNFLVDQAQNEFIERLSSCASLAELNNNIQTKR